MPGGDAFANVRSLVRSSCLWKVPRCADRPRPRSTETCSAKASWPTARSSLHSRSGRRRDIRVQPEEFVRVVLRLDQAQPSHVRSVRSRHQRLGGLVRLSANSSAGRNRQYNARAVVAGGRLSFAARFVPPPRGRKAAILKSRQANHDRLDACTRTEHMASRGFTIVFTLLGVALVVSMAGFVCPLSPGRARAGRPVQCHADAASSAAISPRSRRPTSSAT